MSSKSILRCEAFFDTIQNILYCELKDFEKSVMSFAGEDFLLGFEQSVSFAAEDFLLRFDQSVRSSRKEILLDLEKSLKSFTESCLKDTRDAISKGKNRLKDISESSVKLRRDILDFPGNFFMVEEKLKELKEETAIVLSDIVCDTERILGKKNEKTIKEIFPSLKKIIPKKSKTIFFH